MAKVSKDRVRVRVTKDKQINYGRLSPTAHITVAFDMSAKALCEGIAQASGNVVSALDPRFTQEVIFELVSAFNKSCNKIAQKAFLEDEFKVAVSKYFSKRRRIHHVR